MKDITTYDSYQNQMNINNPFVVVIGPAGSGKKLQSRKVAEARGRQYMEIEGKKENIEGVTTLVDLSVPTTICIYDYSEMSMYAINALLKVAEETPDNLEIVLCSRTNRILPTILSRAQVVYMTLLSRDELRACAGEDETSRTYAEETSRMIRTIGEMKRLEEIEKRAETSRKSTVELFNKIIENIDKVTMSNALKLVDSLIDDKAGYNFIPYLGVYAVSIIADQEGNTIPFYKLEFWLRAMTVKDSYDAHSWMVEYKNRQLREKLQYNM